MRHDEASFKRGYTRENAMLAAAEVFGLSVEAVELDCQRAG
jgi:hypothetical protein